MSLKSIVTSLPKKALNSVKLGAANMVLDKTRAIAAKKFSSLLVSFKKIVDDPKLTWEEKHKVISENVLTKQLVRASNWAQPKSVSIKEKCLSLVKFIEEKIAALKQKPND